MYCFHFSAWWFFNMYICFRNTCSVQFCQSCPALCDLMDCSAPASLSITSSQNLLKLMFIPLVMPSNHLIFCCPLLHLPSIFLIIGVFSNESVLSIRWPKYWSFSFSISPSNQDWFPYCQHPLDHWKSKGVPEKYLLLLYWLCQRLWLCGSQQTVENSSRDWNIRPPDLPPEKSVCRSRSSS